MTHEERLQKMAEYGREARRDMLCGALFLGLFGAFVLWLNVDAVLWVLGK